MNNNWKITTIVALVLSVISLIANIGGSAVLPFGNTSADYWNSESGFQISGSTIIDSSMNASTSAVAASGAITGATTLTMTGESNLSTLVYGGATTSLATTSPPSIVQMTAAQFCDNSEMFFGNDEDTVGSSTTMYTPTAAQLIADCIPAIGDTKSTFLIMTGVDTASTTLTASTSINMLKFTGETDLVLDSTVGSGVDGSQAIITCYNRNGTEVECLFRSIIPGD